MDNDVAEQLSPTADSEGHDAARTNLKSAGSKVADSAGSNRKPEPGAEATSPAGVCPAEA